MAVHGKNAVVKINTTDISQYCNSVSSKRSADSHDTTTFGKSAHTYQGGLLDGTASLEGFYESGATGPKTALESVLGQTVDFVYQPEGTGSGKPQQSGDAVVTSYEETTPVADMITWKAELQLSDTFATSNQSA
ncbi:hypothetical protein [Amycolatopsis sp. Poz14]|uniref:hypothetical protein n=1 Tax=Amycolatopsis sp. Poz14 TaxID=1447705 RepID=UPI001EE8277E|nr:hypothetical protein [Amycolatopsis sp. Poz14]MCG3757372.1 hypothetical protein [Amycolatopsis sp. Poz14]